MKTIYIVTQGSYSDYHIVSVFSTRELAEKFIELQPPPGYDEYEIEEYYLDQNVKQIKSGLRLYKVTMKRDGESSADLAQYDEEYMMLKQLWWGVREVILDCHVYAKDERHAVKIANEKRAQMIASGEWE